MDRDTRIVVTLLFTEHLRMRAADARKARMIGGAGFALRMCTDNFIENMRQRGVQDVDLEAELRAVCQDLELIVAEGEPDLIPLPPQGQEKN